jgi:hypothetical protein
MSFTFHAKTTPRVTIVGGITEDNKLLLAASRTSKKDSFCKKTGRELANKRFEERKFISVIPITEPYVDKLDEPGKIFIKYANMIAERISKRPKRINEIVAL